MSYVRKTHRFGLLTPSSNTVQEPEFSAVLPQTVSLHTGRVAYRDITPQEQMRCVLELESESRKQRSPETQQQLRQFRAQFDAAVEEAVSSISHDMSKPGLDQLKRFMDLKFKAKVKLRSDGAS